MYRIIQEGAPVEDGLYADVLMDEQFSSLELAITPFGTQPIYLIPMSKLVECAKEDYMHWKMRDASYRVFNTQEEYCKWFNQNVAL